MTCRLMPDAKSLSEPMLAYCQLDLWKHISVKFKLKQNNFEIIFCEMVAILSQPDVLST